MGFLKKLFAKRPDGEQLASAPAMADYGQIDLLQRFQHPRPLDDERNQRRWEQILPHTYDQQIRLFLTAGWLEKTNAGYTTTPAASPALRHYAQRQAEERAHVMAAVRHALSQRDTSEALALRRQYEAAQPLGKAAWSGPEPQLSHSALTRRILFLDHWLLDGLQAETEQWLKLYAAEQHLWSTRWHVGPEDSLPASAAELGAGSLSASEAAYWRSYSLVLYVENQETWQRCKGGDHVRRIALQGPDDTNTCDYCRKFYGEQYLIARTPELPHRGCRSPVGCRCEYVPVLDTYDNR